MGIVLKKTKKRTSKLKNNTLFQGQAVDKLYDIALKYIKSSILGQNLSLDK
jgi:hypothetical protein